MDVLLHSLIECLWV